MSFLDTIEQNATLWDVDKDDNALFFVDFILKNIDEILPLIERLNQPIREERDLYYHFFKISFKNALSKRESLNIGQQDAAKLERFGASLVLDIPGFCNYVNEHANDMFSGIMERKGEGYWLAYKTLKDALGHYSKSLAESTIEVMLSYCAPHILCEYEVFEPYFKKHKEQFPKLFAEVASISLLDSRVYAYFLTKYKGPDELESLASSFAKRLCERFIPTFRENAVNSDDGSIFQNKHMFDQYYLMAKRYRLACANEFRSLEETYENTLNEYLQKYGQHFQTQRFSIEPAVEMLKKDDNPFKFMGLTMHFDIKKKKTVFFYDKVFGIAGSTNPLVDAVSRTGMPSSKSFPYHIQDALWMDERLQMTVLNYIVMDPKLSVEFARYLPTITNDIDKELLDGKGELAFETAGSIEMLGNIVGLYEKQQHETPLYQALINGLCENVLNTLEKTLRLLTMKESFESAFFEESELTLGQMLQHGKPQALSRNIVRLLQFHLDVDKAVPAKDERPGRNLRNIHMHNLDHKYKRTNYGDCLWLLFLLMAVFNELELDALERRAKKEGSHE